MICTHHQEAPAGMRRSEIRKRPYLRSFTMTSVHCFRSVEHLEPSQGAPFQARRRGWLIPRVETLILHKAEERLKLEKTPLDGANGTHPMLCLCYINVASSLQVHGDSSWDGSGRSLDSPEGGQCSKHRLPACVLFAAILWALLDCLRNVSCRPVIRPEVKGPQIGTRPN
jgi:hypothetical protein